MSEEIKAMERAKVNAAKSISQTFLDPIQKSIEEIESLRSSEASCGESQEVTRIARRLKGVETAMKNTLYLSQIKSKTFHPEVECINAIETLESFTLSYLDQAQDLGLNYYIYIDPNFPKEITFHRQMVCHVLANLLDNAMQYTQKGGNVYIDIRSKNVTSKVVELSFAVTDTGNGIPKDKVKQLLKPAASSDGKGNGMGISCSFHMLKEMGSTLKIASEEGKGTRFSFSINAKTDFEPSFPLLSELSIGVFIDTRELIGDAKVLYQYLISFGVNVLSINDLGDAKLKDAHALFMLSQTADQSKQSKIAKSYPKLRVICVMEAGQLETNKNLLGDAVQTMALPALPSRVHPLLDYVEEHLPKDAVVANPDDKKIIKNLAKKEERNEPLKILVAEDNPINLKLVQVVLGRYDFIIDSAKNGQIAVDMCKKTKYDLVLMDIDMPEMDGITANRLIKEFEKSEGIPNTPIVALTSHDMVGERSEIMSKGLDEHMAKPLNIARLEMMLERYLGYKSKK